MYLSHQTWRLAPSTFRQHSANLEREQFYLQTSNMVFRCVKHTKLTGSYDKSKSAITVFSDRLCWHFLFAPSSGGKICQLSTMGSTLTLTEDKRDGDLYNSPKFSSRKNLPTSVSGLAVQFSWNFPLAFYLLQLYLRWHHVSSVDCSQF